MAASEEAGSRKQMLQAYSYVLLWVFVSAWVILFNKYLLSVFGFPYPVSLTAMHMAFSSILASLCIKLGLVKTVEMSTSLYMRSVVPIGLLFALVLWLGNAAYLYLSVSFIQMLKASSPMWVFFVGLVFKTETFTYSSLATVSVVGIGIGIASYGEINFVVIGVMYQVASIGLESIRITLVQILLQRKGIKLNPIQTLYYVAPCCFVFLTVPLIMFELPTIMNDAAVEISVPIFFANCISAFVLNLSSFLLIGKTSALTLNIAGVLKDWLLILLSALIFLNPVTTLNLIGYSIAFVGVGWYNHQKRQQLRGCQDGSAASGPHREPAHPKQRLLSGGEQGMLAAEHRHADGMNGSIPALSAGLSSRVADSESGLLQAAAVSGGAGKPASS